MSSLPLGGSHPLLSTVVFLAFAAPAVGQCESFKLTAPQPEPADSFGQAVAIDGGVILLGAPLDGSSSIFAPGAVHSYVWDGTFWSHDQEILGVPTNRGFGTSVAIDGDTAVIGGVHFDGVGSGVSVYVRTAAGWVLEGMLDPTTGSAPRYVGDAVDISGDTIVLSGATDPYYGANRFHDAYVFERTIFGWDHTATLQPDPFDPYFGLPNFGRDVAVDGTTIAVVAPGELFTPYEPTVYMFEGQSGNWILSGKETVFDGDATFSDMLVDVDGDTVVVVGGPSLATDTHVFVQENQAWQLESILPVAAASVAIDGDTIALGGVGGYSDPSAQIFERSAGQWFERSVFRARDTQPGEQFSWSGIALDGPRLVVGARGDNAGPLLHSGAAFVFDRNVAAPFCAATVNMTGESSRLLADGCPSLFQGTLTLHAVQVPSTPGIFVYGDSPRQLPFGGGTRCVGGSVFRTGVLRPSGGQLSWRVAYDNPSPGGQIAAGSTWFFQAWFRDGINGVNTTDGLEITFLP